MSVRYLDPTAQPGVPVEPYELAFDASRGSGAIGLVANSFPDSKSFLDILGRALRDAEPGMDFVAFDKGHTRFSSVPLTQPEAEMLADRCAAVITAYGH